MKARHAMRSRKTQNKIKHCNDRHTHKHEVFTEQTNTDKEFTVEMQLKPGFLTTALLLNVLGVAAQPVAAVLVPHQSPGDMVTSDLQNRVRTAFPIKDNSNCVTAIRRAANANDDTRKYIQKTLNHPEKPEIYCAEQVRATYVSHNNHMYIPGSKITDAASINRIMQEFLTLQRHKNPDCPQSKSADPSSLIYPDTEERQWKFKNAIAMGNNRIGEFHTLLNAFKNLNAGEQLELTAAAASGDKRLKEFKKLVFQHRYRDKLGLNSYQLDKLETYINASRDCLGFPLPDRIIDHAEYLHAEYQYDPTDGVRHIYDKKRNSYINHQDAFFHADKVILYGNTFTHKFDVVAHLNDYLKSNAPEHLEEQIRIITSVLSTNALSVFYPELKALLLEDELICKEKPRP